MTNASKSFKGRSSNKNAKDIKNLSSQPNKDISIYYGELKLKIYEIDGVRWCKKVPVEGSGFYIRKVSLHPLCWRTASPSEVANNYGGKVLLPGALLPRAFTKKAPRVKFKKNENQNSDKENSDKENSKKETPNPKSNKPRVSSNRTRKRFHKDDKDSSKS